MKRPQHSCHSYPPLVSVAPVLVQPTHSCVSGLCCGTFPCHTQVSAFEESITILGRKYSCHGEKWPLQSPLGLLIKSAAQPGCSVHQHHPGSGWWVVGAKRELPGAEQKTDSALQTLSSSQLAGVEVTHQMVLPRDGKIHVHSTPLPSCHTQTPHPLTQTFQLLVYSLPGPLLLCLHQFLLA